MVRQGKDSHEFPITIECSVLSNQISKFFELFTNDEMNQLENPNDKYYLPFSLKLTLKVPLVFYVFC